MTDFNARASRAKRPCPMWVDAFQRDTQHLEADEVGAYFLILMAMWTRESCDLPDDDARLSRIARVSLRLWKSRIGPIIRAFLLADGKVIISQRLRKEAAYVEAEVQKQSDRKRGSYTKPQGMSDASEESGENNYKPLNNNKPSSTVDTAMDTTMVVSILQPNNLQSKKEEYNPPPPVSMPRALKTAAAESGIDPILERLISAVGVMDASEYWQPSKAMPFVEVWRKTLTDDQIIAAAKASRLDMPIPPNGPKALNRVMKAENAKPSLVADKSKAARFYADLINGNGYVAPSAISTSMRAEMIQQKLVTETQLRNRGIQ